jgi:cation transport ATPase
LQDENATTNTDVTSSQPQVEKRSKKKHEVNASTLTPQAQETPIPEDNKKVKKKNKKPKPSNTHTGENQAGDTSQPTSEVSGKEDRSGKKKQKKRKGSIRKLRRPMTILKLITLTLILVKYLPPGGKKLWLKVMCK